MKETTLYFGIDCEPGTPRPDTHAKVVFDRLGIEPVEPYNKFFGAWEWNVPCTREQYDSLFAGEAKWMKATMNNLYESGRIRGAQWNFIGGDE